MAENKKKNKKGSKKEFNKGPKGNEKDMINDDLSGTSDSPKSLVEVDEKKYRKIMKKEKKRRKKGKDPRVPVMIKKSTLDYEGALREFQVELNLMQKHIKATNKRVVIIFEGRDAAGKGGTIKRFGEHLPQRGIRVVALEKPSDIERSQWYFQRYVKHLPSAGEIVLFDRSWYNRAGVEHVMGYCDQDEYTAFLHSVPNFEQMLVDDGIILLKYYFSVSKDVQKERFDSRITDPLKQHKISPVDLEAQAMWDQYTDAKEKMLYFSDTPIARWTIIRSNNKKKARLECIKHILRNIDYPQEIDQKKLIADDEIRVHAKDELVMIEKTKK